MPNAKPKELKTKCLPYDGIGTESHPRKQNKKLDTNGHKRGQKKASSIFCANKKWVPKIQKDFTQRSDNCQQLFNKRKFANKAKFI